MADLGSIKYFVMYLLNYILHKYSHLKSLDLTQTVVENGNDFCAADLAASITHSRVLRSLMSLLSANVTIPAGILRELILL